jgi:hypothetical protein
MNKQALIKKYAKKFVLDIKIGPQVLRGVYYAPDGSVAMTNRHYLLHIKNAHQLKTPVILNPRDGQPIEGTYPNVNEILNESGYKDCIRLAPHARIAAKAAAAVAGAIESPMGNAVIIAVENGVAWLRVHEGPITFEAFFGNADRTDVSEHIVLNAQYLLTALQVFEDAEVERVLIHYKGAEKQIKLVADESEDITIIILPIRRPRM